MAESHSPSSSPPSSSRWGREASNDVEAETIHRPQEVAERLDSALELNNITARKIDEDALSILLESDGCVDKYRDALEQEMEDEDTVRQEVEASLMELGRDSEDESEHTESQRVEIENNGNSSKASSVSHVSGEDHHAKDAPSDSTGTSSRRQSCRARKSVDYRFHPLNGYKARLSKPKPVKIRQRAFNGKTMFATKCLKPSDGKARGYGVWPPKNAHTKKGREQDITCDICKGQVHWMCAGFKNDDPAPTGEWHCPDCREQIKRGVPPKTIEVAPQYRCIRGNCVLRDKQRVERVEGDEEEYVVELIAGRKAISRNEDKSRNFVYLVKWWGYGYDDMTWEPPSNLEHHSGEIDDFVKEAARLELPLHKRVTLLAEARKYWDENGEERE
ncbi:hypothetical protein BCR39DRAFT_519261 [Naematelia encephala]|uniref:Chromo domain-containing protein n=1 Tax=Naematelia encephala TaxID=71784 RepID=A0A1Y2BG45_9TREE|nr:hypothetical protein BCR39DRAFT_519261 [Naematelia encephala]